MKASTTNRAERDVFLKFSPDSRNKNSRGNTLKRIAARDRPTRSTKGESIKEHLLERAAKGAAASVREYAEQLPNLGVCISNGPPITGLHCRPPNFRLQSLQCKPAARPAKHDRSGQAENKSNSIVLPAEINSVRILGLAEEKLRKTDGSYIRPVRRPESSD